MKTSTLFKGFVAVAMFAGGATANAAHTPSPCATGEVGAGTNCMYLTHANATYDSLTGDRTTTSGLTMDILVWMDFGQLAVQGGGFDILFDTTYATSATWTWGADFTAGEQTLDGSFGAGGYTGIQFDDFAGNGFGGSTGTQPGFSLVGTLSVAVSQLDSLLFSIAQPYTDATFPNCFAPGAGSGAPPECVATDFYNLQVNQVPLPAAAWLMMGAMGSLFGFGRKRKA